ncbi:MAG: uroporphyrinogen decarboxylase [Gammaproteobacteria bacterium]|nr:uroporphyrinogen decarboxylase [Gammaproteobacteria bacterium]
MTQLKNDRLLRALRRQPVDVTPIWIMRQAGRYLPEYRKIRETAGSFMKLCKTPELACTVTLQPLARFPLDAAILFSDILTIPDAMGLGLSFREGEGPVFERPIQSVEDIKALSVPDPEMSLGYVLDAIRMVRQELAGKVPLIGFCGSPWTIATYMVEGKSNKAFPKIKNLLREDPRALHQLLDVLAQSVSTHLNAQIKAGVQAVMLFDTWGGMLETAEYQEFSLRYCQQIMASLIRENEGQQVPVILFTKGGAKWLELMAHSGCDALGLDWMINMNEARARVGGHVALQGNMDPQFMYRTPEAIREEVARILQSYGSGSGHIFNLGHGILPDISPENVAVLVDAVHEFSHAYHQ